MAKVPLADRIVVNQAEAAELCGVSREQIRRWMDAPDFPTFTPPGATLRRIPVDGLRAWVRRQSETADELRRFAAAGLLVNPTRCPVCDAPLDADGCPQHPHIRRLERAS